MFSAGCVSTTDVPNLLLVVLLVAMDKHSSDATVVEAVQTVEAVVRLCESDIERVRVSCAAGLAGRLADLIALAQEANLCSAISAWVMLAAVPVRARVLQLVSSGRSAMRLTRWLAFSFLTDYDLSGISPVRSPLSLRAGNSINDMLYRRPMRNRRRSTTSFQFSCIPSSGSARAMRHVRARSV